MTRKLRKSVQYSLALVLVQDPYCGGPSLLHIGRPTNGLEVFLGRPTVNVIALGRRQETIELGLEQQCSLAFEQYQS